MKKRKIGLAVLIAATAAGLTWVAVEHMRWFDIPRIDHFAADGLGGEYETAANPPANCCEMRASASVSLDSPPP